MTTANNILLYTWNFLKAQMGGSPVLETEHRAFLTHGQANALPLGYISTPRELMSNVLIHV